MSLAEEKKKEYIKNPYWCPYCGSDQIEGDKIQSDYNLAWMNVTCLDCEKEWEETYTLTEIREK